MVKDKEKDKIKEKAKEKEPTKKASIPPSPTTNTAIKKIAS